jgi:hypothetical protein
VRVRQLAMNLHRTASQSDVVFQLSHCGIESVAHSDFDVLVLLVPAGFFCRHNLAFRQCDIYPNVILIPVQMVAREGFDDNTTARNVFGKLIQFRSPIKNDRFHGG